MEERNRHWMHSKQGGLQPKTRAAKAAVKKTRGRCLFIVVAIL